MHNTSSIIESACFVATGIAGAMDRQKLSAAATTTRPRGSILNNSIQDPARMFCVCFQDVNLGKCRKAIGGALFEKVFLAGLGITKRIKYDSSGELAGFSQDPAGYPIY